MLAENFTSACGMVGDPGAARKRDRSKAHQGRMDAIAEALGIGRHTLNKKIGELNIDKSRMLGE